MPENCVLRVVFELGHQILPKHPLVRIIHDGFVFKKEMAYYFILGHSVPDHNRWGMIRFDALLIDSSRHRKRRSPEKLF